jgi:hypothetical protein
MIFRHSSQLTYKTTHSLNSLSYQFTMLYNSIILALTAVQVLAQDQYIADDSSDNTTAVEGIADPSPTTAPYVPVEFDGGATDTGAGNGGYTSNVTDPSASAISVNYGSAASSAGTSNYTTEYYSAPSSAATGGYTAAYTSPAASDASSQSEYSSNPSSIPAWVESPAPSVPPTNPPVYLHIKFEKDPTKCLAIFDTSHQDNTPVK